MTAPQHAARPLPRPAPLSLALMLAFAAPATALAQQASTLPAVTVSASALSLGSDDMSTPVTVLDGDELVRTREGTLGETLSGQPGITSSPFGAGASRPIIRGMDGPRVKVLSDGAAAIGQRRRSTQHFDLFGQHRFGRHRMVGADGRGILDFRAVGQDLDARAVHAADNRAAGAGAEMAGGDAGLAGQGFAQRAFAGAHQFIAFKHGHRRAHVVAAQRQGAG